MTTWVKDPPGGAEDLFPLLTESGLTILLEDGVTPLLAFPDSHQWLPDAPAGGTWTRVFPP